MFSMI